MRALLSAATVAFYLFSQQVFAVDPGLDWKTIESDNLLVHYAEGHKAYAEHAMAITEAAHKRLTEELDWTPREKTHVVLSDETDGPNGYATAIYFNRTVLFVAPPSSINTLEDFDDWLSTLIFHEYTHIIHLDKSAGSPEYLRGIFGRFFFLFPNIFQPSWVTEGLATHKETYVERGIGRGQSTMYASMMRAEVANGMQPVTHVNLPVSTWPAGTTRYLYGVYFMRFIAETYGEEKLQQWVDEYSNNLIPFFINNNASRVFGKDLTVLWQEYEQWLKLRFEPQIAEITAAGLSTTEQISQDAYRTDAVRAIRTESGEEVYYVRNSGYKRASLMHIDAAGESEELLTLTGSADMDIHPTSGILLTQNEFCNNYTIYKDIYLYKPGQGSLDRLTECGRYIHISWFPDGRQIAAVHHEYGKMSLHLLNEKAEKEKVLWSGENGEIIGQIDVSPDAEKIVASMWRRGSGWNLELFDIAEGKWTMITSGSNIAAYPQFTGKDDILFSYEDSLSGSSYEAAPAEAGENKPAADADTARVYNLYRYDTSNQQVTQLSNLIGGAFQSSQAGINGSVYYTGYSAEGYAIYKLGTSEPVAQTMASSLFSDDALELIDYKEEEYQQRNYSALSNMYPRWWFPALGFSDQRSEWGLTTAGNDALGIHNYSITASYDTKLKRAAGQANYAYADRLFLSARLFNEISLDGKDDIARINKRTTGSLIFAIPKYYLQQQYNFLLGVIYDNSTEVDVAVGISPLGDFEDELLAAGFLYQSSNVNPLSISDTDGIKLRLVAEDSNTLKADYTGQVYTLDWRGYMRTGRESVFALRFVQGWGTDSPRPFKLGGEGLNTDVISVLFASGSASVFNARNYALRGYAEGETELVGRRLQVLSAEWRFPIQRIENGIMVPPIGLMQWFGEVFAETGSVYQDSPETYYSSAGMELTADINVFYFAVLRTRLGYAHGFDKDIGDDRFYIKVGGNF